MSRGESYWLGIHIVRPGSGQKASYCAGRLPGTLRRCRDCLGSSDAMAVSLMSPTRDVIFPHFEGEARESGEGRSSGILPM